MSSYVDCVVINNTPANEIADYEWTVNGATITVQAGDYIQVLTNSIAGGAFSVGCIVSNNCGSAAAWGSGINYILSSSVDGLPCAAAHPLRRSFESESTNQALVVYPNPASDFFDVHFAASGNTQAEARLYDGLGKIVRIVKVTNGNVHIEVRDLPTGVYQLRISGTDHTFNQLHKVIIAR